jgi:hypothetical protein
MGDLPCEEHQRDHAAHPRPRLIPHTQWHENWEASRFTPPLVVEETAQQHQRDREERRDLWGTPSALDDG